MDKKYKQLESNPDYVELEKKLLQDWNKKEIFKKVNSKKLSSKGRWVYYDGPITANNLPHYGHAITWTVKDAVPRYWTMRGYNVSRNMGWDCQGIPVEYEVEKRKGFTKKEDIEDFGVGEFNKLCKESVLEYRGAMEKYETRIGRWMDQNDSYATMDSNYIESMWWSLKTLYKKELLYKGYKVVPYSTRAGTTLSNAEVSLGGYKEIVDPAVTVKFMITSAGRFKGNYLLAWTTTPWTLPGNLMLSVGKGLDYVIVESSGNTYILAKDCVERVFGEKEYKVVEDVAAKDLLGLDYKPLLSYYKDKKDDGAFKVIFADHVTTDEGTGLVHLAPYGEEDFNIFMDLGIELFDYLDDTGHFIEQIKDYSGMFYKKANKYIIEDLKKQDLLFKHEDYPHQMPMCWRTDTPLIYKPVESWFLAVNKIKKDLLTQNSKVTWVPEHVKAGRFGNWLKNARDWALSRNRYWGTPIPVWVNDKTGEVVVVGSFNELAELSGTEIKSNFDPHRPYVDDITWKGKDGGTFKRIPDVLDVWYDSGSMPFAQYHYPFENKEMFQDRFPANFISESVDQTRGWFYSLIVINTALFGVSPYKAVSMSGMLLGDDGQKLSKSKKNYPPMDEVLEKYGADILRYFLLTSPVVRGESAKFSNEYLNETKKEFFTTLWNSYRYFVTYAQNNGFSGSDVVDSTNVLDTWVLSRLDEVVNSVNDYMQSYEIMYASRELAPFVQDLSTWYIRRSRDRISSGDPEALNTLYYCLFIFSKLIAPFTPFLADEIYTNITMGKKSESVHLESYPEPTGLYKENKDLLKQMSLLRQFASLGNSIRKTMNISLRQPLAELHIVGSKSSISRDLVEILKDELNVKEVVFVDQLSASKDYAVNDTVALKTTLNNELILEGQYRNLVRELQNLRKQGGFEVSESVDVTLETTKSNQDIIKKYGEELKSKVGASTLQLGAKTEIK